MKNLVGSKETARLLKIADCCERLACSRSKLYDLFAAGAIRTVSIGRSRRVKEDELIRYIESLDAA